MAQAIFEPNLFPYNTPTSLKPSSFYTHLPAYEDGRECSETSAYKLQTPENYPQESIQVKSNFYAYRMQGGRQTSQINDTLNKEIKMTCEHAVR